MLLRTLPIASLLALSACVTVTEVPAEIPSLKLVPEAGVPSDYCKRRTQGATNVIDITFLNDGTAPYGGGDPVTVTFDTGKTRGVSRGPIPPIGRGKTATVAVPVPLACFAPDCEFTIKWSNQPEIEGFCPG